MTRPTSLTVQSVLYNTSTDDVERSAQALANAAGIAARAGLLSEWSFLIGDCSATRSLDDPGIARISTTLLSTGGSCDYEFFAHNLGHGGGHNRLAPKRDTEFILFLNPDSLLAPNSLLRLLEAMTADVGATDGRQLPLEHPKDYDEHSGDTSWASGACLMTRREAFDQVNGFDHDSFFLYCDDVDYCWRLKSEGWRVTHQPAARVFHDKRLTKTGDIIASPAEIYYSAEAALLLAHKWSRPQIVESILATFDRLDEEATTRAAAAFRERLAAGDLPTPRDPDHSVSQFVAGNYAVHRY